MSDEAELHSQHPISELFAPDNEVHGLWMSGTGVIPSNREHLEKHKIIRSLVLPRPDNPALAKLIERLGPSAGYYTDMPEKIRTTTALGKALGAEVRWHDGEVTGIHVTIVNPERENGWAHITIRLPFVEPGKFWAMRLERRRQTDEFGRLWRAYEALRRPSARQ